MVHIITVTIVSKDFRKKDLLEQHKPYCKQHGGQIVKLPTEEDKQLKFKNHHKQMTFPFIIYADFESYTKNIDSCETRPEKSSTEKYQKHEASSYGYQVISANPQYTKSPVIYRGPNVIEHFISALQEEEKQILGVG